MKQDTSKQKNAFKTALFNLHELEGKVREAEVRATAQSWANPFSDEDFDLSREAFINQLVKSREEYTNIVSDTDKKALGIFADMKIATLGPGLTAESFTDYEIAAMKEYVKTVSRAVLYEFTGISNLAGLGPIAQALLYEPTLTIPKYPDEPKNESTEEADPGLPYTDDNKPPVKMTEQEVLDFAREKGWMIDDANAYAESLFSVKMQEYQKKCTIAEWQTQQHNYWREYKRAMRKWECECKCIDRKTKAMEAALALGALQIEPKNVNGFLIKYFDKNFSVITRFVEDKTQLRDAAYKELEKVCKFYTKTILEDDTLAAIAIGDIEVLKLYSDGFDAKCNLSWNNIAEEKSRHFDSVQKLNDVYAGYLTTIQGEYNHSDATVEDATEKRLVVHVDKYIRTEDGRRICPICGLEVEEETALTPAASTVKFVKKLEERVKYNESYSEWERLDAAVQLTKAALKAVRNTPLTGEAIAELLANVIPMVKTKDAAMRYLEKLTSVCVGTEVNAGNLEEFKRAVVKYYDVNITKREEYVCPVCGKSSAIRARGVSTRDGPKARTYGSYSLVKAGELTDYTSHVKGTKYLDVSPGGLSELYRDGSQQAWNPFTDENATFTTYSFRPADKESGLQIGIVPASFNCIKNSIDNVLNDFPYIKINEYFMRNNVSSVINLFQAATEGKAEQKDAAEVSQPSEIKAHAHALVDIVKNMLAEVELPFSHAVNIPFTLYHKLKGKMYGNKYRFPYVPAENPITRSSNLNEWGSNEGVLEKLIGGALQGLNAITGYTGIGVAKPFPAPTWKLTDGGSNWQLNFELNFINDEYTKARNNYMCANTIINNNRWIQKGILAFPGALYEIAVPTGVRELMCAAEFQLKPLGVNRHVPPGFFTQPFSIGSMVFGTEQNPMHKDAWEVIPDAYSLTCTFKSVIDENLNNSVFAYYLDMMDLDTIAPGTVISGSLDGLIEDIIKGKTPIITTTELATTTIDTNDYNASIASAEVIHSTLDNMFESAEELAAAESGGGEGGGGEGGDGGGTGGAPMRRSSPKAIEYIEKRFKDPFRWDKVMEDYTRMYDSVRNKLKAIKQKIVLTRDRLTETTEKKNNIPPSPIRKSYIKKESKLLDELQTLMNQAEAAEDELIELQMKALVHGKEKVMERVAEPKMELPEDYFFEIPQLDELTLLKIKFMTSAERKTFITEKKSELAKMDKWGIHKCKDFVVRYVVIKFILDAMRELHDLMRDCEETDPQAYDEYRFRMEMLNGDLNDALDAKTPFRLNLSNIIYIPKDKIPEEFLGLLDLDKEIPEPIPPEPEPIDPPEVDKIGAVIKAMHHNLDPISEEYKKELIKQHTREVINQMWGSEEALATAAYDAVIGDNTRSEASQDKRALIILKSLPDQDYDFTGRLVEMSEVNIIEWMWSLKDKPRGSEERKMWDEVFEWVYQRMVGGDEPMLPEELRTDEPPYGNCNRAQAIFYITQDLYRRVEAQRTVMIGNAVNSVTTRSSEMLNGIRQRFDRLEN